MKLVVQIPCFNEEKTLPDVLAGIPNKIDGIDSIEVLVIDDGSTDNTVKIAESQGVDHVIKNGRNLGLAKTFNNGIEKALEIGADIIVNTDGDNQYASEDIDKLVAPVVAGEADIVIGDRGGMKNEHFSFFKRILQVVGSTIIRKLTGVSAKDAVSGFRAISKEAARQVNIVSEFSYTIEMLVQSSSKRLRVISVPVNCNPKTRESRLFNSVPQFLKMSGVTLIRTYTMYKPLRVFSWVAFSMAIVGVAPVIRFLYFYLSGDGSGHVQSLVLGSMLIIVSVLVFLVGLVADLICFNRKLIEANLMKLSKLEEKINKLEKK